VTIFLIGGALIVIGYLLCDIADDYEPNEPHDNDNDTEDDR